MESAARSLNLIRQYLKRHQPAYPYEKGMLVWASAAIGEIWSPDEQRQAAVELLTLQHEDGGFTLAGLLEDDAEWKRGRFAAALPSDGYGTGFALFVARQAGIAADDARGRRLT